MKVLVATFFIVLADQITKLYVKGVKIPILGIDVPGMPYQSSISVYGDFFKITFIENPGMAFGLQIGGKLFLSLFTIFATVLLLVFLYKNRNESFLLRLALAFILGGAIGNLIDRVFYGKIYDYAPIFYGRVVDFLHFDFPNFSIFGKNIYSWPIFNIADIFVTIGFLMILFGYKKIFNTENEVNDEIPVSDENKDLNSEALLINNSNAGVNPIDLNELKTTSDSFETENLEVGLKVETFDAKSELTTDTKSPAEISTGKEEINSERIITENTDTKKNTD